MGMKRIAIAAISVLALLLATSASAARIRQQKPPAKCVPGHSRLLAVDTQAQVYKVINQEGPFPEAYGCVYGRRSSYLLGRLPEEDLGPGGGGGVRHIELNGSMAAYEYSRFGEVGWASWMVAVRDLGTGRWLHIMPTGKLEESNPNPESAGIGPAVTIVVKGNGSVAWIAEDRLLSENGPTYYQVHAVDKTGSRVLAAGTNIDPHSLALAGSTLYWTQGGKPESAVLN
jgi:hypothetical protein